jgi:hypothetical protein
MVRSPASSVIRISDMAFPKYIIGALGDPAMLTRRAGIGKPAFPWHKGIETKGGSPCHAKPC